MRCKNIFFLQTETARNRNGCNGVERKEDSWVSAGEENDPASNAGRPVRPYKYSRFHQSKMEGACMETTIIFFPEYYLLGYPFFLLMPHLLPGGVGTQKVGPWR
jgi:hypothetical protein